MKRYIALVATLWVTFFLGFGGNAMAQSDVLDSAEASYLEFVLLYSELKQWRYEILAEELAEQTFSDFAVDEQQHFEVLQNLAEYYAIEVSIYYWGCNQIMLAYPELDFMCAYSMDTMWWEELEPLPEAAAMSAYLEELGIRELKQALVNTDEQLLIDAYIEVLNTAYHHLLSFAAILHENPFDYEAQILDQADVDLALYEAMVMNGEDFEINAGFNDAWYEPATDGQGFFITVYPEKGTVFVGWFTFDMDFPGQDVIAGLGDACQRWLTAQGPYDGKQAELVVYNSSGGLFDSVLAVPQLEPIGSINLQFENCESGTVSYDLPSYGLKGEIPIQRVASDNIAACQMKSYLNR